MSPEASAEAGAWTTKRAAKEFQKGVKEARKNPDPYAEGTLDPELFKNWKNIPEEVKPELYKMAEEYNMQSMEQYAMAGDQLATFIEEKGIKVRPKTNLKKATEKEQILKDEDIQLLRNFIIKIQRELGL